MPAAVVEIWELIGPYWRLPVRVVWTHTLAEVRVGAGAALTRKMRAAAEAILEPVSKRHGNTFFLDRDKLESVARKFHGDDPEDVIEWMPAREDKVPVTGDYKGSDFINEYCQSPYGMIRDPLLADAIWTTFCKFMMHWLLNRHRTVPLWFAELNAFCLRRNWPGVVARYEVSRRKSKKMEYSECLKPNAQSMLKRGVGDVLITRHVTNVDPYGNAGYILEATTLYPWEQVVRALEEEKRSRTRLGYRHYVREQLKRQLPRVLAVYEKILRETKRPLFPVPERYRIGGKDVWGEAGGEAVFDRKELAAPEASVGDLQLSGAHKSEFEDLAAEDEGVPEVSDIQSPEADVRNAGGEPVDGPGNT